MTERERGVDRAGRRTKRLLTPLQKYEIWLQLVRQEVSMAEAAAAHQVDRSTVLRIRQVAKQGALVALAESRPGTRAQARDTELDGGQGRDRPAERDSQGAGRQVDADRGKGSWG